MTASRRKQVHDAADFVSDVLQNPDEGFTTWGLVAEAYIHGRVEVHGHWRVKDGLGLLEDEGREWCVLIQRLSDHDQVPEPLRWSDLDAIGVLHGEHAEVQHLVFVRVVEVAKSGEQSATLVASVSRLRCLDLCHLVVGQSMESTTAEFGAPLLIGIGDRKLEGVAEGRWVATDGDSEAVDEMIESAAVVGEAVARHERPLFEAWLNDILKEESVDSSFFEDSTVDGYPLVVEFADESARFRFVPFQDRVVECCEMLVTSAELRSDTGERVHTGGSHDEQRRAYAADREGAGDDRFGVMHDRI